MRIPEIGKGYPVGTSYADDTREENVYATLNAANKLRFGVFSDTHPLAVVPVYNLSEVKLSHWLVRDVRGLWLGHWGFRKIGSDTRVYFKGTRSKLEPSGIDFLRMRKIAVGPGYRECKDVCTSKTQPHQHRHQAHRPHQIQ